MALDASLLNTQHYIRYGSRVKWSKPREGVAPSHTPWCSSYRKGSLRVTLDYGRQLYLLLGRCRSIVSLSFFLFFFLFFFFYYLVFRYIRFWENSARYSPSLFEELCKQNLLFSYPFSTDRQNVVFENMSDKGR